MHVHAVKITVTFSTTESLTLGVTPEIRKLQTLCVGKGESHVMLSVNLLQRAFIVQTNPWREADPYRIIQDRGIREKNVRPTYLFRRVSTNQSRNLHSTLRMTSQHPIWLPDGRSHKKATHDRSCPECIGSSY